MELKVQCNCGQKYTFDVEPVNGRMPFSVNCPACGVDGTPLANTLIGQTIPAAAPIPATLPVAGLKINREATPPPIAPVAAVPPPLPAGTPPTLARPVAPKKAGEFNMGLGILGAFLGATVGSGLMIGFYMMVGFRFPWLGLGIGALTGYGAKLLYKGTSNGLGASSAGIALIAVVGTLFFIYGGFPIMSILSVIVSVVVAYRIAAGS